jgi:uncharacterized membrane protein HdeD (DUF308 family)
MPGFFGSMYSHTWWSLFIRGVAAVIFGVLAIGWPDRLLAFLVTLLGILILVVGLAATIGALMHRDETKRWLLVLIPGLVGVVIGIITIAWPAITTVIMVYLVAIWALVYGIGEIYSAIRLRRDMQGEWMPSVIGIISAVFGVALLVRPLRAGAVIMWLLGLFFLILGILWLIFAFRARKWKLPAE